MEKTHAQPMGMQVQNHSESRLAVLGELEVLIPCRTSNSIPGTIPWRNPQRSMPVKNAYCNPFVTMKKENPEWCSIGEKPSKLPYVQPAVCSSYNQRARTKCISKNKSKEYVSLKNKLQNHETVWNHLCDILKHRKQLNICWYTHAQ